MAAPNIVNVSTILGKTAVQSVGTTTTAILTNAAGSGKVLKVNALYCSNVNGSLNGTLNASVYRATVDYWFSYQITIPANASLDILSKSIYLEEGDAIRLAANAANYIQAVCSYEEIS